MIYLVHAFYFRFDSGFDCDWHSEDSLPAFKASTQRDGYVCNCLNRQLLLPLRACIQGWNARMLLPDGIHHLSNQSSAHPCLVFHSDSFTSSPRETPPDWCCLWLWCRHSRVFLVDVPLDSQRHLHELARTVLQSFPFVEFGVLNPLLFFKV